MLAGMASDSPDTAAAPVAEPTLKLEKRAIRRGAKLVAGVDEAGRGPLAGPVVVSAVVLNTRRIPDGINDSKVLTHDAREALYEKIMRSATVSIVVAPPSVIARLNILWATMWAMSEAVRNLSLPVDHVLIDGNTLPKDMPCNAEAVVDGDALSLSIAAASIVAKVTRDRMCQIMHCEEPQFGFDSHKGYSAPAHLEALTLHGPGRHHRMDFAPCIEAARRKAEAAPVIPAVAA
jgi:ribonuclease HII